MTENGHLPVLPAEVIEFLDPDRAGVYVDCTLGLAGHALAARVLGCPGATEPADPEDAVVGA